MSLKENLQGEIFTANNELPGLLGQDHPMVIFSEEIRPHIKDSDFKELYSRLGRSGTSPALLTCVTIFQFMEDISDEVATEYCTTRLDWKIALHLPIEGKDFFDSSRLCRFRQRLLENEQGCLIFDKILEIVAEKGYIKKHTKQRIDATHVLHYVSRINTTDLIFRGVKSLVKQLKELNESLYDEKVPNELKKEYAGKCNYFGLSEEERAEKQKHYVEQGYLLKELIEEHDSNRINEYTKILVMEQIFQENLIIKKKEVKKNSK